jgi:poly(3-hydroxyalkanoate) synthetase
LPGVRHGPRPLALYLATASRLERQRGCEAGAVLGPFLDGLKAYWRYPRQASPASDEVVWSSGSARLLARGPIDGAPVLLVPSLVNRARVLDLLPGRSLIEALADAGYRTLLLDWGEPSRTELGFGLDGYVAHRLEPALAQALLLSGRRPVVLGYCMGGLLTLALAARARPRIAGLALLATPWDFTAARNQQPLPPATAASLLGGIVASHGHVPANTLDWSFAALDPAQVVLKYAAFSRVDPATSRARAFVAIEDWLADGVALAGPVARECLLDWYVANRPAMGSWRVGGVSIRPERLDLPVLVAVPSHDRIVPEASAMPLARALPGSTILRPASGHIGMVVGGRARDELWRPLLHWLDRVVDATA